MLVETDAGFDEFIEQCQCRELKLAVTSSSDRPSLLFKLSRGVVAHSRLVTDLEETFPVIVSCDDVQRKKPDPECYLKTASLLGVAPAECIVLEDTPSGVLAAKRAGMACIAVPNDYTVHADLSQADHVAPSFIGAIEALGW